MSSYVHIPEKYIDLHQHPWNYTEWQNMLRRFRAKYDAMMEEENN